MKPHKLILPTLDVKRNIFSDFKELQATCKTLNITYTNLYYKYNISRYTLKLVVKEMFENENLLRVIERSGYHINDDCILSKEVSTAIALLRSRGYNIL